MSYVQRVLQPGEVVRHTAAIHWVIYLPGLLFLLVAIATYGYAELVARGSAFWPVVAALFSRLAVAGGARPRAKSACGYELPSALHRARIHHALPDHGATRLRAPRHRLRAGEVARGIEIAQALSRELPQSRRVPRGLHGCDRQDTGRAAQAEMAAHRRLLVSARRHADRRVLAGRKAASRRLGPGPGRRAVSGAGITGCRMTDVGWQAASVVARLQRCG